MRLRLAVVLPVIASSASIAHFSAGRQVGTVVRGFLVDSLLDPVAGATITVVQRRLSMQSGRDGEFRFVDVPPGMYDVSVTGAAVHDETVPMVTVTSRDSTCVLFVVHRDRDARSAGTGAAVSRLLVLNGTAVMGSETRPPRKPGTVIQIRHPWLPANIVQNAFISADSAQRRFGIRAAQGAHLFDTRPHAPCSAS
jgi:hypothetical protein